MKTYIAVYFGAALVAMFLVPFVSRLAKRLRLVDVPGPRKVHKIPIPRIGGIVFVISTLVLVLPVFFLNNTIGQAFRESQMEFMALLVGAVFVFVVGLIDDLRSVKGYIKLLCVVAASLLVCASGSTIRSIAVGPWFVLELGWAAWPVAVFWITLITVSISVIDGLDGLAGGLAGIVCGAIAVLALWDGQTVMPTLMLALLGSITGFLFFNFHPAKIFMGDGGAMFLGFMIGAGSLVCQSKTPTLVGVSLPFLVLGIPILDIFIAFIRRLFLDRRSVFSADRGHLHHHLLDMGLSQRTVVITINALTLILASFCTFMLVTKNGWQVLVVVFGLIFVLVIFACVHAHRFPTIRARLKHSRSIKRKERIHRKYFEKTQLRMREADCLEVWWESLCKMGERMQFRSMELLYLNNGHSQSRLLWNASEDDVWEGRTLKNSLPVDRNGEAAWELRTCIEVNDNLEISSLRAMLLGRIIDEFSPLKYMSAVSGSEILSCSQEQVQTREELYSEHRVLNHIPTPINVMGVPVVPFESYVQALGCIERIIESGRKSFWVAINPIKCYNAWQDPRLLDILQYADVGICDGVGTSVTSRLLYGRKINRCTGCDLFFEILSEASRKDWSVFMLGASAESNAAACRKLQERYPGLRIVGRQDGYFTESSEVVERINASKADILFVALGSPKQEYWIGAHREAIEATFCMGVGGSFDIVAGNVKRAPEIFHKTGTEFLYRLVSEPRKRWAYQKVLIPYVFRVLMQKLGFSHLKGTNQKEELRNFSVRKT